MRAIRTKQQAAGELSNCIDEIGKSPMNKRGEAFLATSEYLPGLLPLAAAARDQLIEGGMKMQDIRAAILEAEHLILLIQ